MRKKLQLLCLALIGGTLLHAQTQPSGRTCGTPIPGNEWNEWFNKEVEKFKANVQNGKTTMPTYQIPVIVHIIHSGGAVGVGDNISQAQVVDQINILNADFAGTGLNASTAPAPFAPVKANSDITFCLATKDPTGGVLPEPGISRITATTIAGVTSVPSSGFSQTTINNTIKPATIWNPVQYCNIWILKLSSGLLGYATFPAGTTLPGVTGGGSNTNDGVVVGHNYFGSIGSAAGSAPYDKGRTLTHELGHWLGLRHVWGDGNCLTDFCNDTPWAKQSNFGCPAYPAYVNRCGTGQSPNGEMTMNFMDYTDDPCMYMFTLDQKTRMQTAMSQGTYRNQLGTHGLCSTTSTTAPGPANAQFDVTGSPCVGQAFTPINGSSGGPTPNYTWTSVPGASFSPNQGVASPAITFTAPGTYTLYLTATNTVASSTYSMVVSNVTTCPKAPVCLDTLRIIRDTDTLTTYTAPSNSLILGCQSGYTGFLAGTNCYKDKEFAQFYPPTSYSDTPMPQVNSMIVLFNKNGTKATPTTSATQIYCKIYSGAGTTGPTSQLASIGDSLGAITRTSTSSPTNQVTYCGNPTYVFASNIIIPHKFNFAAPVVVPATGFFGAVSTPYTSTGDSINIFSNTTTHSVNDSSSWVFQYNNYWRTLRYNRGYKVQLAILPQITCRPTVGIAEQTTVFNSNISVMPNPSSGVFNIIFTLPETEKIRIRIYNSLGQQISSDDFGNVSSNFFTVDLSTKSDGIYFMEITNGKEKVTKKVIIQH